MSSGDLAAVERPRRVCACGTVVWEGRLPKYESEVRCPHCGRNHSLQPPLSWVLGYVVKRFRRWHRVYGLRSAFRNIPAFFRYRQPWVPPTSYETPNPSMMDPNEPVRLLSGEVVPQGPNWA